MKWLLLIYVIGFFLIINIGLWYAMSARSCESKDANFLFLMAVLWPMFLASALLVGIGMLIVFLVDCLIDYIDSKLK